MTTTNQNVHQCITDLGRWDGAHVVMLVEGNFFGNHGRLRIILGPHSDPFAMTRPEVDFGEGVGTWILEEGQLTLPDHEEIWFSSFYREGQLGDDVFCHGRICFKVLEE